MVSDVKRKRGNKWSEDEHRHTATNANIIVMLEKIILNARKILSGTARCAGPTPTATARWGPRSGGGWRGTWSPSSSSAPSSTSPGSSRQSWSVTWCSLQISILLCSTQYLVLFKMLTNISYLRWNILSQIGLFCCFTVCYFPNPS